nr:hypothetical protein [uncultured Halomonas sp.]
MNKGFYDELADSPKPKDEKTSIRNKYNRRLDSLARVLDDFIYHSEVRLDPQRAGKIRNREETEEILRQCKKLRESIPNKDNGTIDDRVYRNLCEVFGIDPGPFIDGEK